MAVWWVNHGRSLKAAQEGGYLWAPVANKSGRTVAHWANLALVVPGDVVVSYAGRVVGLCKVVSPPRVAPRPADHYTGEADGAPGRRLEVEYVALRSPIELPSVAEAIRDLRIDGGPVNRDCRANQGYLWRFSADGLAVLRAHSEETWPEWARTVVQAGSPPDVTTVPLGELPRKTWLFQANPSRFHLAQELLAMKVGDEDTWTVTAHADEMRAGDAVILWQTGQAAGVYAVAELQGEPQVTSEEPKRLAVPLALTRILQDPLLRGALRQHPVLQHMNGVRGNHGTNFAVTPEQWQHLQQLLDRAPTGLSLGTSLGSTGLRVPPDRCAQFLTGLQTKAFVILSGISGTGKTKIAQHLAALLPDPAGHRNLLFLPVRPDWRDGKPLLGYHNPLTDTYEATAFLDHLLAARDDYALHGNDASAWFVLLDEMNLARVEYYLADLLSVLESGRDDRGWTREGLPLSGFAVPALPDSTALHLPPNLYFIGTVNVDETTHAFSPKVLDRAFTIELNEVDFAAYPPGEQQETTPSSDAKRALLREFVRDGWPIIDKVKIRECVEAEPWLRDDLAVLNERLRADDLHFGYRVFDEIAMFVWHAQRNGLWDSLVDAFDAAVLMKVLPKFHGSRARLERPLVSVLAWCLDCSDQAVRGVLAACPEPGELGGRWDLLGEPRYPRTFQRAARLLRDVLRDGFATF